jgi:hypothetical protein
MVVELAVIEVEVEEEHVDGAGVSQAQGVRPLLDIMV